MKTSLQKILNEAINYANSNILTGGTQLKAQTSTEQIARDEVLFQRLQMYGRCIHDLRKLTEQTQYCSDKMFLTPHERAMFNELDIFVRTVNQVTKYSIGNCTEHAMLVLAFLIKHYPEVRVEIVELRFGDHIFLAINRAQGSLLDDPISWGDDAFICDSWAKAAGFPHCLFPAKQYKTSLALYMPFHRFQSYNLFGKLHYTNIEIADALYKFKDLVKRELNRQLKFLALLSTRAASFTKEVELDTISSSSKTLIRIQMLCSIKPLINEINDVIDSIDQPHDDCFKEYVELRTRVDNILNKVSKLTNTHEKLSPTSKARQKTSRYKPISLKQAFPIQFFGFHR